MNITKLTTIFALSLIVIPEARADFMTYFLNCTHSPARSSMQLKDQPIEKESFLSELAMNPSYSLPGTQEEFENPFDKLFEQQTQKLMSQNSDNRNMLNIALWKLFNPSIHNEFSGEDELNSYLFEIQNPTYGLLETDIEEAQKQNSDHNLNSTVANPDPVSKNSETIANFEGYLESKYLNQVALSYFAGDPFVEAIYGPLGVQFSVPADYIYEITQKYAPSMLKLQLPINIEIGAQTLSTADEIEPTIPAPDFPTDPSLQKIVNGNEPFVPQPYNPPMPDSQPAKDEEITQSVAESKKTSPYLPEMIGGVDVSTSY